MLQLGDLVDEKLARRYGRAFFFESQTLQLRVGAKGCQRNDADQSERHSRAPPIAALRDKAGRGADWRGGRLSSLDQTR